jgi:hypothetical protein
MAEEKEDKSEKFTFTDEAAEYLGIKLDDIKDIDGFKQAVDEKFVVRNNALEDKEIKSALTGKIVGGAVTNIKRNAKNLGIDLEKEDFEGKKWEEINDLVFDKISESHKAKISDLESKIGQSNDDAVKEWETKYSSLEKNFKETKTLLDTTSTEFDTYKQESAKKEKDFKLDVYMKEGLSKLNLKPEMTQIEKVGFNTLVSQRVKLDLSDSGELLVHNSEGEQIKSEKETGKFKGLNEVLEEIASEAKVLKVNPEGGKAPATPKPGTPTPAGNNGTEQQGMHINYDARK